MANKYKHLSDAARRERSVDRMCRNKRAFSSEEEAFQKGQKAYLCPHCGMWHRSGKMTKFIAQITKKKKSKIEPKPRKKMKPPRIPDSVKIDRRIEIRVVGKAMNIKNDKQAEITMTFHDWLKFIDKNWPASEGQRSLKLQAVGSSPTRATDRGLVYKF